LVIRARAKLHLTSSPLAKPFRAKVYQVSPEILPPDHVKERIWNPPPLHQPVTIVAKVRQFD
jgi:hypothetical protein